MVRGEIYFVNLAPRSGSERSGRRPCIVVSHDAFNANPRWHTVTVVPLTTAERWQRASPITIQFTAGEGNLPKACSGLAHQVTTVDKGKIVDAALGRLSEARMTAVNSALSNYLQLA